MRVNPQLMCTPGERLQFHERVTGEALFSHLSDVEIDKFKDGLKRSEKAVDYLLNLVAS